EMPVVPPRPLGIGGGEDVLALVHGHEMGEGVKDSSLDVRVRLDFLDVGDDVLGVGDVYASSEAVPEGSLLHVSVQIGPLLLVQVPQRRGFTRVRTSCD